MVPTSDGGHTTFSDIRVEDISLDSEKAGVTSWTGKASGEALEDMPEKLNDPIKLG